MPPLAANDEEIQDLKVYLLALNHKQVDPKNVFTSLPAPAPAPVSLPGKPAPVAAGTTPTVPVAPVGDAKPTASAPAQAATVTGSANQGAKS
jgi:hypothetical protein